jgi:hypothetical protein
VHVARSAAGAAVAPATVQLSTHRWFMLDEPQVLQRHVVVREHAAISWQYVPVGPPGACWVAHVFPQPGCLILQAVQHDTAGRWLSHCSSNGVQCSRASWACWGAHVLPQPGSLILQAAQHSTASKSCFITAVVMVYSVAGYAGACWVARILPQLGNLILQAVQRKEAGE